MRPAEISALEAVLGYRFKRRELLEQALTHSSFARETETKPPPERASDNEQMEFLGDSVLNLVTAEELFRRFPQFREGQLSKLRAHLVSRKHLMGVAQQLQLGSYLRLGQGEEKSGGNHKAAILGNALEAVLAAIYLDGGLEKVRHLILATVVSPELERIVQMESIVSVTDFKSALQEKLQAEGHQPIHYQVVEEQGPQHKKTFTVEARVQAGEEQGKEYVGRGTGATKKMAEQNAARQLLDYLTSSNDGVGTDGIRGQD